MNPSATSRCRPWFVVALVFLGLVAIGEGWLIYRTHAAAGQAERRLQTRRREFTGLRRGRPAPTEVVAAAIAAELQATQSTLAALDARLQGGAGAATAAQAPVPSKPTDAYFDLVAFGKEMRRLARAAHVGLANGERFGFAAYANGGPEPEHVAAIFHQRQVLDYLLRGLFAAGPQRLVEVSRSAVEQPPSGAAGAVRSGAAPKDTFVLAPARSAAVPGQVATSAYRIGFIGETATLRKWLAALASFDLPVVVRLVEVEPLTPRPSRPVAGVVLAAGNAAAPLVARSPSRFTVTLECLESPPSAKEGEGS